MILIPNVLFEVQKQDAGDFDIASGVKKSRMYLKYALKWCFAFEQFYWITVHQVAEMVIILKIK